MTKKCENDILETSCLIANAIRENGNDPRNQLFRCITSGNMTYITRCDIAAHRGPDC